MWPTYKFFLKRYLKSKVLFDQFRGKLKIKVKGIGPILDILLLRYV